MALMVSISGIRGVVGHTLTPEVVVRYTSAFAGYCLRKDPANRTVVVGRDGRITGEPITDLVAGTLAAKGMKVRLLGICPTPTVQLAVEHEHAAGGIAVTASHNPMEWNGMKFVASTGMFLDADENREFWALAEETPSYASWKESGSIERDDTWIKKHIDAVLALPLIDVTTIRSRKFTVVLDCINAAGGVIVPSLLSQLGCRVIPMNCDVSGVFARTPEPIPENLTAVADRVRTERADLGIVVDPDVDRLVLINEAGEPYGEEYTIATAVKCVLEREAHAPSRQSTVVVNLSTTRAVEDIAAMHGARCLRTPVGEINVARRMKQENAVIGGEGSGGVILPAVHLGRDAIVGIGLILQYLAGSGKKLSEVKKDLPQYSITKAKIPLGSVPADTIMRSLEKQYGNKARVNGDDGLKFDFPDYWIHLRKSNTEPIMRVIVEAHTADAARSVVNQVLGDVAKAST